LSEATTKPRILAVDDSRVMRIAMKKILGKDYDVIEAEHGEDAWTLLTNDPTITVVFTDLNMPYLDGYGLLDRMRQSEDARFQDMPVIIITGKEDDDQAKQQALDRGADDFISKPFESIQLIARAKAHVKFKETTSKLTDVSEKLERQAAVDEVTGLGGQRYFCKAAEEGLAYIRRNGGQYVLVRMDIDDFNQIFIKNGKNVADGILKSIGNHLVKQVRQEDMLARVGLAKFAMFLRDTPLNQATLLAERVRKTIESVNFKVGKESIKITVSIALYEPSPSGEDDVKAQMVRAEKYLEEIQKKGGNQVISHSELKAAEVPEQVNLETALKHLQHDEMEKLSGQIPALFVRMLPLLEYMGNQFGKEVKDLVEKLKQTLAK
jgi:two-component system cell cycle response regulator